MDRLFLDANVLFSAAHREDAGVARLWSLERVVLLTSTYAIDEAERNLSTRDQKRRLQKLLAAIESVPASTVAPSIRAEVSLPDKDLPILAGALAAGATHLITGDVRHFGRYFGKQVFGIVVVPPARYLEAAGAL